VSSFSSQINTAKHPLSLLSLSFCTEEFFWKILKVEKLEMNIGISFTVCINESFTLQSNFLVIVATFEFRT